jgi:flagellar protein FlaG
MSTTAVNPAAGPGPKGPELPRPTVEEVAGKATAPELEAAAADLRLVIEEDSRANSFVYKIVDARTGKVVQQFPREEILRLRATPDYAPGTVIDARS